MHFWGAIPHPLHSPACLMLPAPPSLFPCRVAPIGMIFIPCRGGWSHRPDEFSSARDIGNGVSVLAMTLAQLSGGAYKDKSEL